MRGPGQARLSPRLQAHFSASYRNRNPWFPIWFCCLGVHQGFLLNPEASPVAPLPLYTLAAQGELPRGMGAPYSHPPPGSASSQSAQGAVGSEAQRGLPPSSPSPSLGRAAGTWSQQPTTTLSLSWFPGHAGLADHRPLQKHLPAGWPGSLRLSVPGGGHRPWGKFPKQLLGCCPCPSPCGVPAA